MKKFTFKRIVFIFFLIMLLMQSSYPCGEYRTISKVIIREGAPSMIVYPESKSELFLKASPIESTKLAPYLNRYIMADFFILKKNDGSRYLVEKISHIKPIFPHILSSKQGTELVQIKKEVCRSTN